MSHTRSIVLVLAAAALVAESCGSSTIKSTPTTTTSSKFSTVHTATQQSSTRSAFIARADSICRRLNKRAATQLTVSLHTVGTTATPLAGYYRDAITELRKLSPPAGMANAWRTIVFDIERAPSIIVTMGRFALRNDMASTNRTEIRLKKIQEERIRVARNHGFTDCGEV